MSSHFRYFCRSTKQLYCLFTLFFILQWFCSGLLLAQAEHPLEQEYQKALLTERQGRFIEFLGLLRDVAEKGHPGAQNYYGYMLDKSDEDEEAVKWYKKSADQNHIDGIISLAKMYAVGEGVKQDVPKAVKLYEQAIELGSVEAMLIIASAYQYGSLSFERNSESAMQWYTKAAEKGHVGAMRILARAYASGDIGLIVNNKEALRWYEQAAETGDPSSIEKLVAIYKKGGLGEKPDATKADYWRSKLDDKSQKSK